jgi:hypothetical protein
LTFELDENIIPPEMSKEQKETAERYTYEIHCDENGDEGFIDERYPEFSIRWDNVDKQWAYQFTMRHHAKWDPESPLSQNSSTYEWLLKHFGLNDLTKTLPIEVGCKISPEDLPKFTIFKK